MRHKNKKAMELSINFFVVLIITLVVFIFGIKLLYNIFGTATDFQKQLSRETEDRIRDSLVQGELTAIPINEREISRGTTDVFGLGISNKLGVQKYFCVYTQGGTCQLKDGSRLDSFEIDKNGDLAPWAFSPLGPISVNNNEYKIVNLLINVPGSAQNGKCVFNVFITVSDTEICSPSYNPSKKYDTNHKIYVVVD